MRGSYMRKRYDNTVKMDWERHTLHFVGKASRPNCGLVHRLRFISVHAACRRRMVCCNCSYIRVVRYFSTLILYLASQGSVKSLIPGARYLSAETDAVEERARMQ